MAIKNSTPLGYVKLPSGDMAIYPMNNVFLNYTFELDEHWEALRLAVNLIIEVYRQQKSDTKLVPINGNIKVRTQFQQFVPNPDKSKKKKKPDTVSRDQDIKITEDDKGSTYVEFQIKSNTEIPITVRSVVYFGLGLGHSGGKTANQIWLLAEDVEVVLDGETITRYILTNEANGKAHPEDSGIMYVSLSKLSKENTPAGELASFLLGLTTSPQNDVVKKIADSFNASFKVFKEDKDVVNVLTIEERVRDNIWKDAVAQGEAIGVAKGEAIGMAKGEANAGTMFANKFAELKEKGLDPMEIMRQMEVLFATLPATNTVKK